jgi:hypothetical protein
MWMCHLVCNAVGLQVADNVPGEHATSTFKALVYLAVDSFHVILRLQTVMILQDSEMSLQLLNTDFHLQLI